MRGSKAFLAWVVAAYSAGEAVGALGFGWLYGRAEPRPLLLWAVVLSGMGSALYALACLLAWPLNLAAVLTARFVQVRRPPSSCHRFSTPFVTN